MLRKSSISSNIRNIAHFLETHFLREKIQSVISKHNYRVNYITNKAKILFYFKLMSALYSLRVDGFVVHSWFLIFPYLKGKKESGSYGKSTVFPNLSELSQLGFISFKSPEGF